MKAPKRSDREKEIIEAAKAILKKNRTYKGICLDNLKRITPDMSFDRAVCLLVDDTMIWDGDL